MQVQFIILGFAAMAGCTLPPSTLAEAPMQVVQRSYESMTVGADWAAVRADYTDHATILRRSSQAPSGWKRMSVDEWFAETPPTIDVKQDFDIRILGMHGMVYEHLATVWATVEVYEADGAGREPQTFRTVEQLSLVLGPDDRWRIAHVQYQGEADGWPPSRVFEPVTYGGGGVRPDLRFRVSNH